MRDETLGAVRRLGLMPLVNALANGWFRLLKAWHRLRGRSAADAVYTDSYFSAEEAMTLSSAAAVVDCLLEELAPSSVADVGCGTAVYLAELERRGIEVLGYEWSEAALRRARVDPAKLRRQDLTQELVPEATYDLVICFEVAEHLPSAFSNRLAANVVSLGSTVAFSAAQPGQGGRDHVNEQPPAFWIATFEALGFHYREERTERLRAALRERDAAWWLPSNLLIFEAPAPS
jgi:SAM-dependent methyltransferase